MSKRLYLRNNKYNVASRAAEREDKFCINSITVFCFAAFNIGHDTRYKSAFTMKAQLDQWATHQEC